MNDRCRGLSRRVVRPALAAFLAAAMTLVGEPRLAAAQDEAAAEEAPAEEAAAEEEAEAEEAPAEEAEAEEAEAREAEGGEAEGGEAESGEAQAPSRRSSEGGWAPGAPGELWLAAGITLGVGALALAAGGGVYAYASDRHTLALDPMTTQARAVSLGQQADELAIVSNILFIGGGAVLGLGAIWCAVLPFGWHPTSGVRASIGPASLSISGVF